MDMVPKGWLPIREAVLRLAAAIHPGDWRYWSHEGEQGAYLAWSEGNMETSALPERLLELGTGLSTRDLQHIRTRHVSFQYAYGELRARLREGRAQARIWLLDPAIPIDMPTGAWRQPAADEWFDSGQVLYPTAALHPDRFWEVTDSSVYRAIILVREEDCRRAEALLPATDGPEATLLLTGPATETARPVKQPTSAGEQRPLAPSEKPRKGASWDAIDEAVKALWPARNLSGLKVKERNAKINKWLAANGKSTFSPRTFHRFFSAP
jgi:hypothetical protein